MKYKVGDKVRIREDLVVNKHYGSTEYIEEEMLGYAGCIAEIESVEEGFGTYNLSCDNWQWNWPEGALLPCQVVENGKTYEDGLNEAWMLAKKIFADMSGAELNEIFRKDRSFPKIMELSPQEATEKIAEWEKKREFRVNDEVRKKNICGVVIYSFGDGKVDVIFKNGSHEICETSKLTKTGRTIDIAGLLAQIGGTE